MEVDAFAVADAGVLAFGFASYGADVFDICEVDAATGVFDLLVRGYLKEMWRDELQVGRISRARFVLYHHTRSFLEGIWHLLATVSRRL